MRVKGLYTGLIVRRHRIVDRFEIPNAVVDIGLDRILDVMFNGGTPSTVWYLGLINGSASLDGTDTMVSHAGWTENSNYDETTRPTWSPASEGTGIIRNATYADFTMNGSFSLAGVLVVDDNQKGLTAGELWSTAKFINGDKSVQSGDVIRLLYTLQVQR